VNRRLWAVLAAAPALLGTAAILLQRASGPVLFDDEMGFLGAGVLLSSRDATPALMGMPLYPSGYGLVLAAPLSVFWGDPWVVAVAVNVALLTALAPLLFVLARRMLDLPPRAAAAAALLGATLPSVILQTPRAWSETLMTVAVAGWVVLLERYSRLGPARGSVPLAVASGSILLVHRRAAAILAVGLLLIVVWTIGSARPGLADRSWLGRVDWGRLALALGSGVLTAFLALRLDGYVVDELYGGATRGRRFGRFDNLFSLAWPDSLLGQSWALTVATFGLAPLGVLVLLTWLRRRHRLAFTLPLLLATGGVVMTSVLFLANARRTDHLVYERYVAPLAPVLVVLGFGMLLARRSLRWHLPAVAGFALVSAATIRFVIDPDRLAGNVQKLTVPTLTTLDLPTNGWDHAWARGIHVLPITAAALLGLALCVLAARGGSGWAFAALFVTAAVVLAGSAGNFKRFLNVWERSGRAPTALLEQHGVTRLQVLPELSNGGRAMLQYRLGYPEVVLVDEPSCAIAPYAVGPRGLSVGQEVATLSPIKGSVYALDC
jgi:hypothetical protein